jgi:hypothetical protein
VTPSEETGSGPPPLRPSGLVLHHDGRWSHEGQPVRHARLRAVFDRSVRFIPEEGGEGTPGVFVVQVGRFRGAIEVEEAAFFVRAVDVGTGLLSLSDGSREVLDPGSLRVSPRDGALLCTVRRDGVPAGLAARFSHAAQAELLLAAEEMGRGLVLRLAGRLHPLRELDPDQPSSGER